MKEPTFAKELMKVMLYPLVFGCLYLFLCFSYYGCQAEAIYDNNVYIEGTWENSQGKIVIPCYEILEVDDWIIFISKNAQGERQEFKFTKKGFKWDKYFIENNWKK